MKHKVSKLFAFGSALTESFSKESDIDLVVDFNEFDKIEYADNYFNLKFSLEDLFGRNVDLLENKAIRNPFFKASIDSRKVRIYGYRYQNLAIRYPAIYQGNRKLF